MTIANELKTVEKQGVTIANELARNNFYLFIENLRKPNTQAFNSVTVNTSFSKDTHYINNATITITSSNPNDMTKNLSTFIDSVADKTVTELNSFFESAKVKSKVSKSMLYEVGSQPTTPIQIKPKTTLIIMMSFAVGVVLSIFVVLIKNALLSRNNQI